MLIDSKGTKVDIAPVTCFPMRCPASGECTEGLPRGEAAAAASSRVIVRAERPWQDEQAVKPAVADGVTTGIAIAAGAVEMNPIVNPSPLGPVALTALRAVKIGLVRYAADLPEGEKRM